MRNKILGVQIIASESTIRRELVSQYLDSEHYEMKSMEISVAESKYNDDKPFLDVGTFGCNPFE